MTLRDSVLDRRVEPRWVFAEQLGSGCLEGMKRALNIPTAMAKILINRGVLDADVARSFPFPSVDHLIDPFQMVGMDRAVDRVWSAIQAGESILVHGDYDVDGVTGTALLVRALKALGADVSFYIPNRLEEGYGISREGIDTGLRRGATLLISVDCGITAIEETDYAKTRGLDVIITDHHQPAGLPDVVAVINPKRSDCSYPFKDLPGVALAFKLADAVYKQEGIDPTPVYNNLDLVALGCAADIVPLVGENRVL